MPTSVRERTGQAMPLHIVLFEPEIPPNTGNIARLCAATGTALHLIEPLGFSLDDKQLKRAGLDYWPVVDVHVWPGLDAYLGADGAGRRLVASSAKYGGVAGKDAHRFAFTPADALLLGPESRGLPPAVLERAAERVRIPIRAEVRSLNLSTAAGVLLYMALAGCGLLDAPEFDARASAHAMGRQG